LTIEYALLGFLQRESLHGYAIYRRVADPAGLGTVWRLKQGQFYALLDKLEAAGCVTATVEPQAGRPPRKVFHLTRAGRGAFRHWLHSPVATPRQMRQEFLAKLYFARRAGGAAARELIELQRGACREWLAGQAARAKAQRAAQPYAALVSRYRSGQLRAMLAWLDTCEATLKSE
jgi:DNA-binding PadR family transcriptional regulator